jgi:hypothetical protein
VVWVVWVVGRCTVYTECYKMRLLRGGAPFTDLVCGMVCGMVYLHRDCTDAPEGLLLGILFCGRCSADGVVLAVSCGGIIP